jgi:hypothetical protein
VGAGSNRHPSQTLAKEMMMQASTRLIVVFIAGCLLTLFPSSVFACEGCICDGPDPEEAHCTCVSAPDGPGAICVSGGGYCNEEGTCEPPGCPDYPCPDDNDLLASNGVGTFRLRTQSFAQMDDWMRLTHIRSLPCLNQSAGPMTLVFSMPIYESKGLARRVYI